METMVVAVLAIDISNDFADPKGGLPVDNGFEVAEPTNELFELTTVRVATRDRHPAASKHFARNGGVWPDHGIEGTWGFEFYPTLNLEGVTIVSKGMSLEDDGYSGFEGLVDDTGQTLLNYLTSKGVTHVIITGLATDYCVKATALDAVKSGFVTILASDACRAVNVEPGDGVEALAEMIRAGVIVKTTAELLLA